MTAGRTPRTVLGTPPSHPDGAGSSGHHQAVAGASGGAWHPGDEGPDACRPRPRPSRRPPVDRLRTPRAGHPRRADRVPRAAAASWGPGGVFDGCPSESEEASGSNPACKACRVCACVGLSPFFLVHERGRFGRARWCALFPSTRHDCCAGRAARSRPSSGPGFRIRGPPSRQAAGAGRSFRRRRIGRSRWSSR